MSQEFEIFHPDEVAIATTTFYPEYGDPHSSDRIRGNLAVSLIINSIRGGYKLTVVDGGSSLEFIRRIDDMGVRTVPQENKGMDESRFQTYLEATKSPDIKAVIWIEAEKPLISDELAYASQLILSGKQKIIVPARSGEGFDSIPEYQQVSEKSANQILHATLERYGKQGLFPNLASIPHIDWFFGPKMFDRSMLAEFTNDTSFWKEFRERLEKERPELKKWYGYCGPLILPVINAFHNGLPVAGYEMESYRHPKEQTEIELKQKDFFLKRRIDQLTNINLTVDFFCRFLRQK